jgi:hypothetical protein
MLTKNKLSEISMEMRNVVFVITSRVYNTNFLIVFILNSFETIYSTFGR